MSDKLDISLIVRGQLRSFKGYSRRSRLLDLAVFLVIPVLAGVLVWQAEPNVFNVAGILAGVGVFTALLFGLLVNVFNLSVKLRRDEALRPESRLNANVSELFANVAWSALWGLLLVVLLATGAALQAPQKVLAYWYVGLLVAVSVHLVLTVIMSLTRLVSAHAFIGDLAPPRKGQPDLRSVDRDSATG